MPRKQQSRGFKQLRRQPQHHSRVATANNAVVTRQFRYTTQLAMTDENTVQGGVETFFNFDNAISDYLGSEYIQQNHEQFRVVRIKLMARPSTGLYPAPSADATIATVIDTLQLQVSQYNLANFTEVQSYVDYDTQTAPTTYDEILIRPNTKIQCLKPTDWTMIASFRPKLQMVVPDSSSPNLVLKTSEWQSTNYLSANLYGLQGRFSNRYNGPNISLPLRQGIDIFAIATVEMRGVRNSTAFSSSVTAPVPATKGGMGGAAVPEPAYKREINVVE